MPSPAGRRMSVREGRASWVGPGCTAFSYVCAVRRGCGALRRAARLAQACMCVRLSWCFRTVSLCHCQACMRVGLSLRVRVRRDGALLGCSGFGGVRVARVRGGTTGIPRVEWHGRCPTGRIRMWCDVAAECEPRAVHGCVALRWACAAVKTARRARVSRRFGVILTSCSGFPGLQTPICAG